MCLVLTANSFGLDNVVKAIPVESGRASAELAEAEDLVHHGVGGQVRSGGNHQTVVTFAVHTIRAVPKLENTSKSLKFNELNVQQVKINDIFKFAIKECSCRKAVLYFKLA